MHFDDAQLFQVYTGNISQTEMFYPDRYDFAAYKCSVLPELPVLVIKRDRKEHLEHSAVRERD